MIARHGIGVNNIDLDYYKKNNITVAKDPYSNVNSVAEHIIMFIISLAKNSNYFNKNVKLLNFDIRSEIKNIELSGKTMGLIGFGKIGRLVAKKENYGLDMNVIYFDNFVKSSNEDMVKKVETLEELLRSADFINLSVPLINETMNDKTLRLMKKGAYLINTSRGEVLNEIALNNAINVGHIKAAGIDVF